MTTGQLLKDLRLKKGLTQEELSSRTGISVRTIQRIEKDENSKQERILCRF